MTDTAAPSQRAQMASCFTNREWRNLYWIVDESGQKGAFQRNEALRALCGTPLVQLSDARRAQLSRVPASITAAVFP